MNHDPILDAIARRDPVPTPPCYDESAERTLRDLLATFRATPEPAARRRGPAPAWWAVGIGAGVAVAVAATVLVTRGAHEPPDVRHVAQAPPRPAPASPSPTQRFPTADGTTPVDLVVQRSGQALSDASDYLLQSKELTHSYGKTYPSVLWLDETDRHNFHNQEFDPKGNLVLESFVFDDGGQVTSTEVDYIAHQYTQGPAPVLKKGVGTTTGGNDATIIAQELRQGHDKIQGVTTIDGRTVLWLSNDEPGMGRQIWVDASTYLPVRMTAQGSWGSYQIDYTWIPRTAASVTATFAPHVPPGYTKVNRLTG